MGVYSCLLSISRIYTLMGLLYSMAVFLTLWFSKIFSRLIVMVNYKALVVSIIGLVFLMSAAINGPVGIVVLMTASVIGLIAPLKEVGRNHAMGCLLLPVVLYFVL